MDSLKIRAFGCRHRDGNVIRNTNVDILLLSGSNLGFAGGFNRNLAPSGDGLTDHIAILAARVYSSRWTDSCATSSSFGGRHGLALKGLFEFRERSDGRTWRMLVPGEHALYPYHETSHRFWSDTPHNSLVFDPGSQRPMLEDHSLYCSSRAFPHDEELRSAEIVYAGSPYTPPSLPCLGESRPHSKFRI